MSCPNDLFAAAAIALVLHPSASRAEPLGAPGNQWLGMNTGHESNGAAMQAVMKDFKTVGLRAARKGGNVSTATPSQALSDQDAVVETMAAAGVRIHWVINYRGHGINPAGTSRKELASLDLDGPVMATWLENYKQRCVELFVRYSSPGREKILHYIVGNEPNLGDNFTSLEGRPDVAVKLTRAMYEAARQVNPRILVQCPPVSTPEAPYLQEMIKLGVAGYCHIIGIHVYGGQTHPGRLDKPWQWLQAAGVTDKPVAISEAGVSTGWNPAWSDNKRQWQSDWLNNFHVMAKRYGYSFGLLFTHDDDHTADWALLRADGARVQPSWDEISTLTKPQGLRNPGFETANDIRRQWYPEHNPDTDWPSGFDWQFNANPRGGVHCARISTNARWDTAAHQVVDNLTPGTTYRVTGWIRSDSPKGGRFNICGSQAHNGIQSFASDTITTNTWTQVAVEVTPTNPWIVISLNALKNESASSVYFDDFSVVPAAAPK